MPQERKHPNPGKMRRNEDPMEKQALPTLPIHILGSNKQGLRSRSGKIKTEPGVFKQLCLKCWFYVLFKNFSQWKTVFLGLSRGTSRNPTISEGSSPSFEKRERTTAARVSLSCGKSLGSIPSGERQGFLNTVTMGGTALRSRGQSEKTN